MPPHLRRHELKASAEADLERWSMQINELRPDYRTAATTATDRHAGPLAGDDSQNARFRTQFPYFGSPRSKVARLQ